MKNLFVIISLLATLGWSQFVGPPKPTYKDSIMNDSSAISFQRWPYSPIKIYSTTGAELKAFIAGGSGGGSSLIHDSLVSHGITAAALPALKPVCTSGAGVLTTTGCHVDTSGGGDSLVIRGLIHDTALAQGWTGNTKSLSVPANLTYHGLLTGDSADLSGRITAARLYSSSTAANQVLLNSASNYGCISNTGADAWSLCSSTAFNTPGTPRLTWNHAGAVTVPGTFGVTGATTLGGKVAVFQSNVAAFLNSSAVMEIEKDSATNLNIISHQSAVASEPRVTFTRSRGTKASPIPLNNGDGIGDLAIRQDTATGGATPYGQVKAVIGFVQLGTSSFTNTGYKIQFFNVDTATNTNNLGMQLVNRELQIGQASDSGNYKLQIGGNEFVSGNTRRKGNDTTEGNSRVVGNINGGGAIQAASDVTAGGGVSAQGDITAGPSQQVHLYFDGRIVNGPLHSSSAVVDSGVTAGSYRDGSGSLDNASVIGADGSGYFIDNSSVLDNYAPLASPTFTGILTADHIHDASLSSGLNVVGTDGSGNLVASDILDSYWDTTETKQYADGTIYALPTTSVLMDTIPGFTSIKTITASVAASDYSLMLPLFSEYPAGKPLTIMINAWEAGGSLGINGQSGENILLDVGNTNPLTLPIDVAFVIPTVFTITNRTYAVTLVHDANFWNLVSTANRSF